MEREEISLWIENQEYIEIEERVAVWGIVVE